MAKLKATEKSKKILKKFFTIILILYIFLFAFMFAFRKYFIEGKNIYTKVSTSHVLQSIPIKDALIIRELTIEKLKNYIKNQEYEKAYDLYSKEYKEFISLENYINEIKKIDIDSVEMAEIKARNDDCYEADIVFDYIDSASELYKETTEKRKISHLTLNWFMQTLLDRSDRMAMYSGFEIRVPFCDYRLAWKIICFISAKVKWRALPPAMTMSLQKI